MAESLPYWAKELLEDKTPFLASDPGLRITEMHEEYVEIFSRGFYYTIDRKRQQVR